jgi:hypothetical protein
VDNKNSASHREIASLEEVLAYENQAVARKFQDVYGLSSEDAVRVFDDTKRWLWLCADQRVKLLKTGNAKAYPPVFVDRSIWIVDEMWHTFILFTKDYSDFCDSYFGFYIHHQPITFDEKWNNQRKFSKDFDGQLQTFMEDLKHQMRLVYDAFGAETLLRWYQEYRKKFTSETIGNAVPQCPFNDHAPHHPARE